MLTDGSEPIIVGAAQMNPQLRNKAANISLIGEWTRRAADAGARLVVFPECSISGYRYESRLEAEEDAERIPGATTNELSNIAAETDVYLAVGIVERSGDHLYNCAALIGPNGLVGKYRKTHIPFQAVDRFVTPGNIPFPVFETPFGRLGLLICYDLRFPEPARILALGGAQIIANLTNLPPPGWPQPEFIFQARSAENRVFLVCADRVGEERGVSFIGRSAIVNPEGQVLAVADDSSEELLLAEIVPAEANRKDLIIDPGLYEMRLFDDRRTDLYGPLTKAPPRNAPLSSPSPNVVRDP